MLKALSVSAVVLIASPSVSSPANQGAPPRVMRMEKESAMQRLARMQGAWAVTTSLFREGSWVPSPATRATIDPIQLGTMLREKGTYRIPGREFVPETIFSFDRFREVYRVISLDETEGLLDVYEGGFEGESLVLTNEKSGTFFVRPDGSVMRFRLTYTFLEDGFRMLIEERPSDQGIWSPFLRMDYAPFK